VAYFLIGKATGFTQPGAGEGRVMPDAVFERRFWAGWWEMVSFLLRSPQQQTYLAIAPLLLGVVGLALAPRGVPRAIVWGLTAGYLAFAFAVAPYTSTHPYYALMLIPILSLAIGVVVGRAWAALSGSAPARAALAVVVVAVVAGGTYKAHAATTATGKTLQRIADYRHIGELT